MSGHGDWLTYQQAGERLGITAEAARQRAVRLNWRRQRGNDGRSLIQIPAAVQPSVQTPVQPNRQMGEVAALWELARVLRDQLAKAETRADRAEERTAVVEDQARALRRLIDAELVQLRAEVAAVRAVPTPAAPAGRGWFRSRHR